MYSTHFLLESLESSCCTSEYLKSVPANKSCNKMRVPGSEKKVVYSFLSVSTLISINLDDMPRWIDEMKDVEK